MKSKRIVCACYTFWNSNLVLSIQSQVTVFWCKEWRWDLIRIDVHFLIFDRDKHKIQRNQQFTNTRPTSEDTFANSISFIRRFFPTTTETATERSAGRSTQVTCTGWRWIPSNEWWWWKQDMMMLKSSHKCRSIMVMALIMIMQRPKNLGSRVALLPGKFLCV